MGFFRRTFSSIWFNLFSVLLTLGLLVILGFWHRTELQRGAADYRQTMDELSYDWYERFNLPFLVFDELFTPPQETSAAEEAKLIMRRWRFWVQHSDYPELVNAILRIRANPLQNQGESPDQVEVLPAGLDRQTNSAVWVPIVNSLSGRLVSGPPPTQRHMLFFIDSIPYLVINYGQPSFYVLVMDKQVFYSQFIKQITLQVLPKIRTALPGFSPAIMNIAEKPQVYYCPDLDFSFGRMYIMYSLDDRLDLADQPGVLLDKALTDGLEQLRLETSYFLKVWLNRAPANDSSTASIIEESIDSVSLPQGVFFAFLPRQGDVENVVFLKSLPLFALGYGALALMGLSLLTASGYNRKMVQLLVRQDEFVATMTHELRTPLHIITNGASNLADGIVSQKADVARYGELLYSEAKRLSEMVESILNFADVTHRQPLFHDIDVPVLVDEVMAPYRLICREQHIQLDEKVSGQADCVGSPEAIRLILSNLLSNAIKHAGSGKWIGVSITVAADLTILVQDRGPGIPKREIPKVTDPFFRGSRQRQDRGQGNGLGLSIVKRIAEAEQGSLVITSEEGKGSNFLVKLPYQAGEVKSHV